MDDDKIISKIRKSLPGFLSSILLGLFAFLISLISSQYPPKYSASRIPVLNDIRVKIVPNTFEEGTPQQLRIQAVADFDETCNQVDVEIPGQDWGDLIERSALIEGSKAEWTPRHAGIFLMKFSCNKRSLGDAKVSVVKRSKIGLSPKKTWILSSGKPIYRDGSFYEIPIIASAENSSKLPSIVSHDTYLKVLDRNGQLANIEPMLIQRNTAISDPVYLRFPIGADYRLIAFEEEKGQQSNELNLSWSQLGPKLSLVAFPDNITLYSSAISSGEVQLYLAEDARQIKPSQDMKVLFAAPTVFKSDPQGGVSLSQNHPVGTYKVSSATATGSWSVSFKEPRMGVTTFANIEVQSTLKFFIIAVLAGLLGVVVGRQLRLFKQEPWAIVLELVSAGAAAYLLLGMISSGWVKIPGVSDYVLSVPSVVVIGLVGGYIGLGIFRIAKIVIDRLPA